MTQQPRLRIQHVALGVPLHAHEAIRAFYGTLLGFPEKPVPTSLEGRGILWFVVGDDELELHFVSDPEHRPDPTEQRHFCLEVPDVEALRQKIAAAGHEIIEATPIPNRPRFFCHDPFGYMLEFTTIQGNYLE